MNLADSTRLKNLLIQNNFKEETNFSHNTDIVIINTCSVRHSAENRIYGRLGHYKKLKETNNFILILIGCMAEKEKSAILKKANHIDYIVGTHNINIIPDLIKGTMDGNVHTGFGSYKFANSAPDEKHPFRAFVNIIHGCSNFCSYCIVPYVRGKEISRPPDEITDDIKKLIDKGVKEIVLLGQNVNSYGNDSDFIPFNELLLKIDKINGLKRLKFLTSHPKDFSFKLIDTLSDLETLCHDIHLPLQSGSDNVLKLMNRKYTFSDYLSKIERLRMKLNNPRITTDLLVGFPEETENDYKETLKAIQMIEFDSAYMYKYSPRKGTEAYKHEENISQKEKQNRLSTLIEIQNNITTKKCFKQIDTNDKVLIESISRNNEKEFRGISSRGWCVVFHPNGNKLGDIIDVKITGVSGQTLKGVLV